MTNETSTLKPPYNLVQTFALYAMYGVLCTNLLVNHHPAYFHDWPGWLEAVLYTLIAIGTALLFTAVRYVAFYIRNRGRWLIIGWAASLAAGFWFWPHWGLLFAVAATIIGFLADRFIPMPEPDRS